MSGQPIRRLMMENSKGLLSSLLLSAETDFKSFLFIKMHLDDKAKRYLDISPVLTTGMQWLGQKRNDEKWWEIMKNEFGYSFLFPVWKMFFLWCFHRLVFSLLIGWSMGHLLFSFYGNMLNCFVSEVKREETKRREVTDLQLWRQRWRRVYRTPGQCPRPTWTYPLLRSPGRWRWWSQQCWPESSSCTSQWSETSGKYSPLRIYWHRYHRRSYWGETEEEIINHCLFICHLSFDYFSFCSSCSIFTFLTRELRPSHPPDKGHDLSSTPDKHVSMQLWASRSHLHMLTVCTVALPLLLTAAAGMLYWSQWSFWLYWFRRLTIEWQTGRRALRSDRPGRPAGRRRAARWSEPSWWNEWWSPGWRRTPDPPESPRYWRWGRRLQRKRGRRRWVTEESDIDFVPSCHSPTPLK